MRTVPIALQRHSSAKRPPPGKDSCPTRLTMRMTDTRAWVPFEWMMNNEQKTNLGWSNAADAWTVDATTEGDSTSQNGKGCFRFIYCEVTEVQNAGAAVAHVCGLSNSEILDVKTETRFLSGLSD
jgi:hypothetical protein